MIDRRTFLKSVTLGTGGLVACLLQRLAGGGEPSTAGKRPFEPRMTLAIETSMFRQPAPDAFALIRKAGYRFVELGGRHLNAAARSKQTLDRLRSELKDADLTPVAAFIVHQTSSTDETRRQEALTRWRRSIDAASQLGVKLITTELTGDLREPEKGEAAFRKSMDVLLPLFEDADIHLSAEPHPGDFFETAMPTIRLLRSYGSKHLGYLHCMPHTFYLGESMREVIAEAGELLTHVHVSDTYRTERIMARPGAVGLHLHLRPGLGEVDFQDTFDALAAAGYIGHVSVQLLSHADAPAEAAELTREYLQKLLGERLVT